MNTEVEQTDWSETWMIYMYRVLLFGFAIVLLSCIYMVHNESGRVTHAVISTFSEMMKKNFVLTVMVSLVALMFSLVGSFFEKERFSNIFLLFSELAAFASEFIVMIIMMLVVYRLNGDNVWEQMFAIIVNFVRF